MNKIQVYYVFNGENTLYVKTLDDALNYIRDNLYNIKLDSDEEIILSLATIGIKNMSKKEFDELPEFDG